jgi:cytochrome P450
MGFINGERWKQLRSEINQYFTHETTTQSTDALNNAVRSYLMSIAADQFKDETKNQLTLHVASALGKLVFYCTAERIYGPMTTDEKNELWSIGEQRLPLLRFALAGPEYRFKIFRSFCEQARTELSTFQTNWFAFNKKMYESRKTLASPGQFIVPLWESMQENRIGRNELLQTIDEMLFANLDVASHVLTWMVIHIAENPRVQKNLREEAAQQSLNQYLQQKTTLLGQSFLESMRLRPFTAFSIPESASEDKIFHNDFRVPAATSIVVDTIAINIDNPFWGEDSNEFRPERFKGINPIDVSVSIKQT